jgi:hypothetical protein
MILTHGIRDNGQMSYILDIAKDASFCYFNYTDHAQRPSLDIRSIPQIITAIK